ncbi:MAG: DUF835 domain-containing protein, partial [Candidatus Thermoplasmatota archaeon]|nr:DUF835 domain-containing protein [Candidatus Thermoplasmatota archaeon]
CGVSLVESMGISAGSLAELMEHVPLLISESGLGYGKAKETEKGLVITLSDSLEATAMVGSSSIGCFFTAGYLAGLVSGLFKKRYECIEKKCVSRNHDECVFHFIQTDSWWKAYAPKKRKEDTKKDKEGEEEQNGEGEIEEKDSGEAHEVSTKKEGDKKDIPLAPPEEELTLECGTMYMMKEERSEKSYQLFLDTIGEGEKGLCITRDFPKKVKAKFKMGGNRIIWLSTADDKSALEPTKLSALFYETQMFLKENPGSTILLSGIEYLVTHNGFLSVLKFIQLLSEQASVYEAIVLVPINPGAFDGKELKLLEGELVLLPE